jgi:hypothetical protein
MEWFQRLRELRVGILFALLAAVYGFGLGGVFGANEAGIKGHLKTQAESVRDTQYQGDATAMKKVTDKSWTYFKRAHLHANGLSASALALILLMAGMPANRRLKAFTAAGLGIGALGYSMFWMLAGLRAPAMGSTGAAKESLQWLAVPTSALCILGLLVVVFIVVRCLFLDGQRKVEPT